MANKKFVQLHGPFSAKQDLMEEIRKEYSGLSYVQKLGILSMPTHICNINGKKYEIGKTGILEFNNIEIGSLYFEQYENIDAEIDCIVK
jgi:hypothetical protein